MSPLAMSQSCLYAELVSIKAKLKAILKMDPEDHDEHAEVKAPKLVDHPVQPGIAPPVLSHESIPLEGLSNSLTLETHRSL